MPDPIYLPGTRTPYPEKMPRFDFMQKSPAEMARQAAIQKLIEQDKLDTEQRGSPQTPLSTGEMMPQRVQPGLSPVVMEGSSPENPINIAPTRTKPFSGQIAQALQTLDPRALEEARSLADLPEAQQSRMTATFGGKSYAMQPAARVDNRVLGGLARKYAMKQLQEREDRLQQRAQSGKERLVSIPGEQKIQMLDKELGFKGSEADKGRAERAGLNEQEVMDRIAARERAGQVATREQQDWEYQDRNREQQYVDDAASTLLEKESLNAAQRAALAKLLPLTRAGRAMGPVSGEFASAMTKQSPTDAQVLIESNPILKREIDSITTLAKDLANAEFIGENYQNPQDLQKLTKKYQALVKRVGQEIGDEELAAQLIQSKMDEAVPAEAPIGPLKRRWINLTTRTPFGNQVGTPGRPIGNVRAAIGLE